MLLTSLYNPMFSPQTCNLVSKKSAIKKSAKFVHGILTMIPVYLEERGVHNKTNIQHHHHHD